MLRSVFLRTHGAPIEAASHTLFVYRGPDWCLQELQDGTGVTVRSWSYTIDKQDMLETPVGDVLHLQVTQKGRDWVGDCLLETGQHSCTLLKENEKGVVLQFEGREQILWRGEGGWPEARTWATAVGSSASATASATAGVPSAPSRLPHTPPFRSSSGLSASASADHRPRGGHRGRPGRVSVAPSASASAASAICKIRLPGS